MKRIFNKEKCIANIGRKQYETISHFWVDKCDGHEVIADVVQGVTGYYQSNPLWEITVPDYSVTIESDGTTTTAKLLIDGKEVKSAKAKRNPEDEFDLKIGMNLALERLWEKKDKKSKKKSEKTEHSFKIGDRVVCIGVEDGKEITVGKHGTIIKCSKLGTKDWYGVEFDEVIDGHSCRGVGKHRYCWNFTAKKLRPEDPSEIKKEFNLGDRVICERNMDGLTLVDKHGVVIAHSNISARVAVEFDEDVNGHTARSCRRDGRSGKDGHCYFIKPEDLRLENPSEHPSTKIKVGSVVRLKGTPYKNLNGRIGVVVVAPDSNTFVPKSATTTYCVTFVGSNDCPTFNPRPIGGGEIDMSRRDALWCNFTNIELVTK